MKNTKFKERIKEFKNKCMGKLKAHGLDLVLMCQGAGLAIFSTAFTIFAATISEEAGEFDPIILAGPAGIALGLSIYKFGKNIAKYESYNETENQITIPSGIDNNSRSVDDIIKNIEESGINFSIDIHDEETFSR